MFCLKKSLLSTASLLAIILLFTTNVSANEIRSGVTTATALNLRSGPGTNYSILGYLITGSAISILSQKDGWYRIKTPNGNIVWADKEYISLTESTISRGNDRLKEGTNLGQKLVSFAEKFLGVQYVWGGTSPDGFDCSGLVKYTYQNFGISLKRVADAQALEGSYVDKDSLKAGDLVFFDTNGTHSFINHVGMYIGNGNFIQASSGRSKVIISTLTSGFYNDTYMTSRRILN